MLKKCPLAYRKNLKLDLCNSVYDFAEANPNVSMDELTQRFGKPEQFLNSYIESLDSHEKAHAMQHSKFVKRAMAIGVAVIILLATISTVWIVYENHLTEATYYEETTNE